MPRVSNPVPSLNAVVRKTLSSTLGSAVPKIRSKEAKITGKVLFRLFRTQIHQRKIQLLLKEPRKQRQEGSSLKILMSALMPLIMAPPL